MVLSEPRILARPFARYTIGIRLSPADQSVSFNFVFSIINHQLPHVGKKYYAFDVQKYYFLEQIANPKTVLLWHFSGFIPSWEMQLLCSSIFSYFRKILEKSHPNGLTPK